MFATIMSITGTNQTTFSGQSINCPDVPNEIRFPPASTLHFVVLRTDAVFYQRTITLGTLVGIFLTTYMLQEMH